MSVPNIVIDGAQSYGTVNINVSGNIFIVEEFKVQRNHQTAKDYKADGSPNRQRMTSDFDTWTGILQIANSATVRPQFGQTFTGTYDSNYGAEIFDFAPVNYDQDNSAGNIRKINVGGNKVYNGSVTTA